MKTQELKKQYEETVSHLHQLKDEIRLEIHLAGMDVQSRWKDLETRLSDLQLKAKTEVNDTTRHAADELVTQFKKLKTSIKEATDSLKRPAQ